MESKWEHFKRIMERKKEERKKDKKKERKKERQKEKKRRALDLKNKRMWNNSGKGGE